MPHWNSKLRKEFEAERSKALAENKDLDQNKFEQEFVLRNLDRMKERTDEGDSSDVSTTTDPAKKIVKKKKRRQVRTSS